MIQDILLLKNIERNIAHLGARAIFVGGFHLKTMKIHHFQVKTAVENSSGTQMSNISFNIFFVLNRYRIKEKLVKIHFFDLHALG